MKRNKPRGYVATSTGKTRKENAMSKFDRLLPLGALLIAAAIGLAMFVFTFDPIGKVHNCPENDPAQRKCWVSR